jgi:hypothetical protein
MSEAAVEVVVGDLELNVAHAERKTSEIESQRK